MILGRFGGREEGRVLAAHILLLTLLTAGLRNNFQHTHSHLTLTAQLAVPGVFFIYSLPNPVIQVLITLTTCKETQAHRRHQTQEEKVTDLESFDPGSKFFFYQSSHFLNW